VIRLDKDDAAYAAKLALPNLPPHYHNTLVNTPYDGSTIAHGMYEILKVRLRANPNPSPALQRCKICES
jgi:hypothetical protein